MHISERFSFLSLSGFAVFGCLYLRVRYEIHSSIHIDIVAWCDLKHMCYYYLLLNVYYL